MQHATVQQSDEIYKHFYDRRDWFPHIRKDYIQRMVVANKVVYEDSIIITYNQYTRRQQIGTVQASKGDFILHQILNVKPGCGNASGVLLRFFEYCNAPVWLSVRADNHRAISFYLKNNMTQVGEICWMKGQLQGLVFLHNS